MTIVLITWRRKLWWMINGEEVKVLHTCIQCGTCIGSCYSGRFTALNTRKILMEFIARGKPVEKNDAIWFCTSCYACTERCPRGIPLTDILLKARRELVKEKGLPGRLDKAFKALMKTGHLVPAKEEHVKLREELDLPSYTSQFKNEAREEVSKIVEKHIGGLI